MIDKVTPQGINVDADSRVRPSNQMIDALNLVFEHSYKDGESFNQMLNDFSGDFSSIKPVPSNAAIEDIFELPLNTYVDDSTRIRVIGSVTDDIFNIIFFFVWSNDVSQMGVWAWDQEGLLPGNDIPGSYIKVYTSEKFNFPSDGFVKGDVVHVGQRNTRDLQLRNATYEERSTFADAGPFLDVSDGVTPGGEPPEYINPDDAVDRVRNIMLYFTDNRNEPKKLDVFKVMSMSLQALEQNYNNDDILDLICACPRTPQEPVSFYFDFDQNRNVSNFTNLPGIQFAYQYIYDDNVESAISTYSKIAIPPAYIQMGAASGSPYLQNVCRLSIPRGTREVKDVRILARFGNVGSFRSIDVISNGIGESPFWDQLSPFLQYNFYNDRVLVPISREEEGAQYSNLPRVAQAQSIVSDRLVYGNYLENYPAHNVSATSQVLYGRTPVGGYNIELYVTPYIVAPDNYQEDDDVVSNVGNSRITGFHINTDGIPINNLPAGSSIKVSWSSIPDRNFHIYNHKKSFHGTCEQRFFNGPNHPYSPSSEFKAMDAINSDGSVDYDQRNYVRDGKSMFGRNKGVKFIDGFNKWKCQRPAGVEGFESAELDVVYGTSAANPLILQGSPLFFSVFFTTNWAVDENAREFVRDALYSILTDGGVEMPTQNGVPLAELQETPTVTTTYDIDCNLSGDVDTFDAADDNFSDNKDLVCAVRIFTDDINENAGSMFAGTGGFAPVGYFIVNKATVTMGLKAFPDASQFSSISSTGVFLGLNLQSVTDVDVRTCIPVVPWDKGGAQVGFPFNGTSMSQYKLMNAGINDITDGNYYYNQLTNETDVSIEAWIPPNIQNCNITKWRTYDRNYLNSVDAIDIVGLSMHELDFGSPADLTQLSSVGHKNLFTINPEGIPITLLAHFQNIGENADVSSMGSALFPCVNANSLRRHCVGVLTGPNGDVNEPIDLLHTDDTVANHYGGNNQRLTLIDGEGNTGYVEDLVFDYTGFAGDIPDPSASNEILETTFGSLTPYQIFKGSISAQPYVSVTMVPNNVNPDYWSYLVMGYRATALVHLMVPNAPQLAAQNFPNVANITNQAHLRDMTFSGLNCVPLTYVLDIPAGSGSYQDGSSYQTNNNNFLDVPDFDSFVLLAGGTYYPRSFKTRANHEFAIVYYDQRGRSGHANYLTNAYVKGYSNAERGPYNKGRVDIQLNISGFPPRWATHYQIVYGGNSTIGDFRQYTTGFAFLENTDPVFDSTVDTDKALIYVSLGLLQGENNVSYSHAFGAMGVNGEKDLYTYSEGDKIRIISYKEENGSTVYPESGSFDFEIVGVKTVTSNIEENILLNSDESVVPKNKEGQFLVLKNNPYAAGFTFADVATDMPQEPNDIAQKNKWSHNTIVEIYSPKKSQDADERFFYEVGEKYDIVLNEEGVKIHGTPEIILQDGDVYWRNIPVNVPPLHETLGFLSIIRGTALVGENESMPRFRNYFLESQTFTDTIPGADGLDWGKIKVVVPDAQTLYKRSSVTFSEKNNYSAKRNNYTMFNASTFNFKDLPNEYGSINYMLNDYDSLFIIQEDKASSIPVSRSILSTAGGTESLIGSDKILGTQKFYMGDYGSDGNPESVVRAEENIYWASKSKKEVYRWSRSKGIEVISKSGMKSYFNNVFRRALEDQANGDGRVRVVGGYDPLRDEFIISIHNMRDFNEDENFYDFEYDGEYITYTDPEDDVQPDSGDPDVIFGCAEFDFSYKVKVNGELGSLSGLFVGDLIEVTATIANSSSQIGTINAVDFYPTPPYVLNILGLSDAIGTPIYPGQSVEIIFIMQVPGTFLPGDYAYNPTFHFSSPEDDCGIQTADMDLSIRVKEDEKDPRDPKDPTIGIDGKSLKSLDSGPAFILDMNNDGLVNPLDYWSLAAYLDSNPSTLNMGFDVNQDGVNNAQDLQLLNNLLIDRGFSQQDIDDANPNPDGDGDDDDIDYTPDWYEGEDPVFATPFNPCNFLNFPEQYQEHGIFNYGSRGQLKNDALNSVNAAQGSMNPLLIIDGRGSVFSSTENGGPGQFWSPYMNVTGDEFGCNNNPFEGWLIVFSATPLGDNT